MSLQRFATRLVTSFPASSLRGAAIVPTLHTNSSSSFASIAAPYTASNSIRSFTSSSSSSSSSAKGSSIQQAPVVADVDQTEIIHEATLMFDSVWRDIVETRGGLQNMHFPREIVWLTGAPGAGKGTMGSIIMKERDIYQLFEVSSLLNSPAFQSAKEKGILIGDRDVVQAVLLELLKPDYTHGVIVDGFPRTTLQAHFIRLLRDKLQQLWAEHREHAELRRILRRPNFSITCFYCSEEESVKRQLRRGQELERLNRMVNETGVGNQHDVRATDVSPDAARKRYRIFKEEVYASLQAIKDQGFLFHFIDADSTPEQVKKQLITEFSYQSSNDLSEEAFECVRMVEPAALIIKQARTFMCTRLNSYATEYKPLFDSVIHMLNTEFMHIIKRQSLAGKAIIRSNNTILEKPIAVNMVLDVLAERGYTCVLDIVRVTIPTRVEPTVIGDTNGPRILTRVEKTYIFTIEFQKPEIRRQVA